jgi:hypothetical protein
MYLKLFTHLRTFDSTLDPFHASLLHSFFEGFYRDFIEIGLYDYNILQQIIYKYD